jgi:hypothetical protein
LTEPLPDWLRVECGIEKPSNELVVNQAYTLTPAEVDLMWKTAPPRMPIPRP